MSEALHVVKCFHITWIVFNTLLSVYFFRKLRQTSLIHPNLRLLLNNIPIYYWILNSGRLCGYLWMEIMSRQMFSPFFENGVCLLFRIVEDIGVASVGMSITQIAIERSCATLFRTKYENMNVAVGRFIAMQSFMGAFLYTMSPISYDIYGGSFVLNEHQRSCKLEHIHLLCYLLIWALALGNGLLSVTILFYLFRYSKKKMKQMSEMQLTIRYQFAENIQTMNALLPPMILFMCLGVGGSILAAKAAIIQLTQEKEELSGRTIEMYLQILHMMSQSYGTAAMTYFLIKFPALRALVNQDIKLVAPKRISAIAEIPIKPYFIRKTANVDYADLITQMWDKVDKK